MTILLTARMCTLGFRWPRAPAGSSSGNSNRALHLTQLTKRAIEHTIAGTTLRQEELTSVQEADFTSLAEVLTARALKLSKTKNVTKYNKQKQALDALINLLSKNIKANANAINEEDLWQLLDVLDEAKGGLNFRGVHIDAFNQGYALLTPLLEHLSLNESSDNRFDEITSFSGDSENMSISIPVELLT